MMYGQNLNSEETWKRIPENSIGVEIGVWKGDSSDKFLRRARHMHLVDNWSPVSYENSDEHGNYENYLKRYSKLVGSNDPKDFQKYYNNIYNSVVERFKDRSITIHRMSSEQFFKTFTEKVDWVYVDGDHSYEGCLKDLRNCLKILKPTGVIFGDDYTNKPGVYQAVNQFIAETNLSFNNFYKTQYEICIHQV
jgi:Methyltransferase domain